MNFFPATVTTSGVDATRLVLLGQERRGLGLAHPGDVDPATVTPAAISSLDPAKSTPTETARKSTIVPPQTRMRLQGTDRIATMTCLPRLFLRFRTGLGGGSVTVASSVLPPSRSTAED